MIYIFLIIYSILILLTGLLIKKRIGFEEYFLAGRSLNWVSFSLTLTATWFGASSIIVLTQESFINGLSSIWIMIVPTLLTIYIFLIFSNKIRSSNAFSIPEILRESYGDFFHFFSSIVIFFYLLLLSSSQAVALGKLVSEFFSLDYRLAVIFGVLFVFIYSFQGGLISVIRTDFIQLSLIFIGLFLITFFIFFNSPSKISYFSTLSSYEFFNPFKNFSKNILITISFTLAWFISPVVWQRIYSAKSDKDARKGLLFSSFLLLILFFLPTWIGITERLIISQPFPDELITFILKHQLRNYLRIIAFIAIVSAIISTLDSIMNVSAMTLSTDIGMAILKGRKINGKFSLFLSTILIVIISIPLKNVLLALGLSSQILVCGLTVPLFFALFLKKPPVFSGILSLIVGFLYGLLSYLKNSYGLRIPIPQWPESFILGVIISLLFFIFGYFFYLKKQKGGRSKLSLPLKF